MFESDVSLESFLAFAQDYTLNGSTVKAVIDHNVEAVDGNGEVRSIRHLVTLQKSDAVFNKSDLLITATASYSMQDIITDDGILVEVEAL